MSHHEPPANGRPEFDLFDRLPIIAALATRDGTFIRGNAQMADWFGERRGLATGYPVWKFFRGEEETWEQLQRSGKAQDQLVSRGVLMDIRAAMWTTRLSQAEAYSSDDVEGLAEGEPLREWVIVMQPSPPDVGELQEEVNALRAKLEESERLRKRLASVQEELVEPPPDEQPVMIGHSAGLRRVREQVNLYSQSDGTVLIHGETGSGKELVARSIHAASKRRRRAFVAVNCAAMPETLLESELFGHERGAFTGADRQRLGKFEVADEGTLFLDEVAELPMPAQAKLLRVLQDGTFQRVGGTEDVKVNVRVVAATHRELARQVERGHFREDLFYRLNVFRIEVPPLRERREDLKELAEHLHKRVAARLARPVLPLSDASLRRIMAYRWPGNIRELANAVERATLVADGPELEIELPEAPTPGAGEWGVASGDSGGRGRGGGGGVPRTRDILLDLTAEQLERLHIMHAIESCGGRVFGEKGAAAKLEVDPRTLSSRMKKFGIPRPREARRGGNG